MLQAIEYLNETGAGKRYILVFSDLKEEVRKGHIRDFDISFDRIRVVALNVTKLRSDNVDPREYMDRLEELKPGMTITVLIDRDGTELKFPVTFLL